MSGMLEGLRHLFRSRSGKEQDRPFLEAAMAACALVSTSEGQVSFADRVRVDQIMETLARLKVFDPHEGVDIFNRYADHILAEPRAGRAAALEQIRAVAQDPETAEILIRLCLAVSLSDGVTSLVEHIEIVSLCGLIGVDPAKIGLDTERLLAALLSGN